MRGLRIYLADGTYNGTVTMSSDSSKISAIRVTRENISNYENELGGPGCTCSSLVLMRYM